MAKRLTRGGFSVEIDLGIYNECRAALDKHFNEYFAWLQESCEQVEKNNVTGFAEPRLKTPRPKKRRLSGSKPSQSTSKNGARKSTKRFKLRSSALSPRVSSVVKATRKRRTRATECVNTSVADGPSVVPNRAITRALRQTLARAGDGSQDNLSPKILLQKLSEEDLKKSLARRSLFSETEEQSVPNTESAVDDHVKIVDVKSSKAQRHERPGSETEWITDDETFYDAKDEGEKPSRESNCEGIAVKPPIKKQIAHKSQSDLTTPLTTRLTRAVARKQSNAFVTPKKANSRSLIPKSSGRVMVTRTMVRNLRTSTDSSATLDSDAKSSAAVKCTPSGTRIKAPGSALKNLTQSAAKRREEMERKRREMLEENLQKEKEAKERKERLLQQRMLEHKQKQVQREKRAAELREQQLKAKEEQRRRQQVKKEEELERRRKEREMQKKAELEQRQKALSLKQLETEQRKLQEEKERAEAHRRKREEMEREKQEKDKLNAIIQHHNSSLQQKALANSYLKKTANKEPAAPQKVEAVEPQKNVLKDASTSQLLDKTYTLNATVPKSKGEFSNYEITPPPKSIKKPPNPANYDISMVQSDDDTDDENQPQKPIPSWAKGTQFIQSLANQFGKPSALREQAIIKNFPPVKLPVDLDKIFRGHCPVSSKYSKRTSSAIWDVPPQLNY